MGLQAKQQAGLKDKIWTFFCLQASWGWSIISTQLKCFFTSSNFSRYSHVGPAFLPMNNREKWAGNRTHTSATHANLVHDLTYAKQQHSQPSFPDFQILIFNKLDHESTEKLLDWKTALSLFFALFLSIRPVMDWKTAVSLFFAPFLSIEPVMDWKTTVSLFFCTVPVNRACDGLKNCCESIFLHCSCQ